MNKQAGRPAYNPGFNNGNGGGGASSVGGELGFLFGRDHGYPDPDPNPPPRLVLFGPWDGLQQQGPHAAPQLEMRTCTECHVQLLAAYFLMSAGGYYATCARCRRYRRLNALRARARARAGEASSPVTEFRQCSTCLYTLPLTVFLDRDARGQEVTRKGCSACRTRDQGYKAARHAAGHAG